MRIVQYKTDRNARMMVSAAVSTDPLQPQTAERAEAIHVFDLHKRFGALEVLKRVFP